MGVWSGTAGNVLGATVTFNSTEIASGGETSCKIAWASNTEEFTVFESFPDSYTVTTSIGCTVTVEFVHDATPGATSTLLLPSTSAAQAVAITAPGFKLTGNGIITDADVNLDVSGVTKGSLTIKMVGTVTVTNNAS